MEEPREIEHKDADAATRLRSIRRNYGTGAAMIAAAGLAIDELLYGKKDDRPVVVVNAQGDPPNVDELGLRVTTVDGTQVVAPPLPRRTPIPTTSRASRRPRR